MTDPGDIESRISRLESTVRSIEARNQKVEIDKAWETSQFRVLSISAITWGVVTLVFWTINTQRPMLNALIPTIGFYLSTRTIPDLKAWWIRRNFSN